MKITKLSELKRKQPSMYDKLMKALERNRVTRKAKMLHKHLPKKHQTIKLNIF